MSDQTKVLMRECSSVTTISSEGNFSDLLKSHQKIP